MILVEELPPVESVYKLIGRVYKQAVVEARGRNQRKRQAAEEWLDVTAPGWRERVKRQCRGGQSEQVQQNG